MRAAHGQALTAVADRHDVERHCERLVPDAGDLRVPGVPARDAQVWRPGCVCAFAGAATEMDVPAAVQAFQGGEPVGMLAAPSRETAVDATGIPIDDDHPFVADLTETPHNRAFPMLCAANFRGNRATLREGAVQTAGRLEPVLVQSAVVAGAPGLFASAAGGAAPDLTDLETADCSAMEQALAMVARPAERVSCG